MPETDMTSALEELAAADVFDAAYYTDAHPDVRAAGIDPLAHYCEYGWIEGRRPNPYFDGHWYISRYPDVAQAGMNPLLHYIRHGEYEGRRPMPYFDPVWYRFAYEIPKNELALRDFLSRRFGGCTLPSPALYAIPRLRPYLHEAETGCDPFLPFLDEVARGERAMDQDAVVIAKSGLLDPNYYLINASDVHAAEIDPIEHFCRWGWQEHRKPNIYFDTAWYLQTNLRISRLKINPLVHYILEGEAASRRPIVYFDPSWYRETYRLSASENALAHFLAHRRDHAHSPNALFDVIWYVRQCDSKLGPNSDAFAHYLQVGTLQDINPSPRFDMVDYRRRHIGRPSRLFPHLMRPETHNPLVHCLRATYT